MSDRNAVFTSARELSEAGFIAPDRLESIEKVAARYAVAVTPAMAELIDLSDPNDPIARQFLPSEAELDQQPDERSDPIGDERHSPVKGIVHRYRDRVLLKPTLICPIYCRFCFRREMVGPGAGQMLTADELDTALSYIAQHTEIWEVILTGGDPLMLSPRRIEHITQRLAAIAHVDVVRWHSRVPVVDPGRITAAVVRAIGGGKTAYLVLHVNHARELSRDAIAATAKFIDGGIPVLSQSVLLNGVNDDVATLAALMRALVAARIKPYYLHHMDLAQGTAHFRTSIAEGRALMSALRRAVSGLAVPHYVLDIPGGFAKAQLAAEEVELTGTAARVIDADGSWHDYPDV
ncbi:MAG TPA: lysine-2,3-aminomutase-like protein [Micropepsaceae bacterium]|nr:lysine-2,3-aminomutase-like protein [Micropepsaceae bacterium]